MLKDLSTVFLATVLTTAPVLAETTPDTVLGTWQTGVGEQPAPDGSTAYLQATTTFTETAQDLIFEVYGDADLTVLLFRYHSSGPWLPQGASAAVPGALEVNMTNDFSRVEVFIDAPDFWAALNLVDCPLAISEAVEIKYCVDGPPFIVSDCVDMDLVMVDQGGRRLRYGGGDVDRCEFRPTAMSADAYFKIE